MAIEVIIRKNTILNFNIDVKEIASLKDLSYGCLKNNYVLDCGKTGNYTILYDAKNIGRGIEVSFEDGDIYFRLPLPSTDVEIKLFYTLIEATMLKLGVNTFERDGYVIDIDKIYEMISFDQESSIQALNTMETQVNTNQTDYFTVFAALNPIYLGKNEFFEIGGDLNDFAELLNRLQQMDVYYVNSACYKRSDDSVFNITFVGVGYDIVFPIKPLKLDDKINSWYVMLLDDNAVKYDDFLNYIKKDRYYDTNALIINLSDEDIENLIEYTVSMEDSSYVKGKYWGKTIDGIGNHLYKIKNMHLDVEELASLNHISVFFRFMIDNGLVKQEVLDLVPELNDKTLDLRQTMRESNIIKGRLRLYFFTDKGQAFVNECYKFNMDSLDYYPSCVDDYALNTMGEERYNSKEYQNEAYLFVPYDEEYCKGLTVYIQKAYTKFLEKYNSNQ